MAEGSPTPSTSSGSSLANFPKLHVNGPRPASAGTSETSPSSVARGGTRSASSKFASLRAAFEKDDSLGAVPDGLKRRLPSSERSPGPGRERNQDYEAEIAKLKSALEQEKELRVVYEERVTSLEREKEEIHSKTEVAPAGSDEAVAPAKRDIQNQRLVQENSTLQEQLAELKRGISTATRWNSDISDSTLEVEFGVLQHEVQNWVVNHFRKAKANAPPQQLCERLQNIGEIRHLDRLIPVYERFEPGKKLAVFQATVACYLMEIFEDKYLFGLPADQEWRKRVRRAAEVLPEILAPVAYGRWRAVTFDAIRQSDSVKESVESASNGIAEMVCITLKTMTEAEHDDERALASLKVIIKRAVALAHLVRSQPANYEFLLPVPGEKFDPKSMDNTTGDETEQSDDSVVYCATFPAVIKHGDELGERAELRNTIAPAKVICNDP